MAAAPTGLRKFTAELQISDSGPARRRAISRPGAIRFKLGDGLRRLPGSAACRARGDYIRVRVSDNAPVTYQSAFSKRMFDPFFTTRMWGAGIGLEPFRSRHGLRHIKGAIAVDTTVGTGTTIDLIFPMLQATEASANQPRRSSANGSRPRRRPRQVLVVDDDAAAGSALTLILGASAAGGVLRRTRARRWRRCAIAELLQPG